jgi:hypothetical protein
MRADDGKKKEASSVKIERVTDKTKISEYLKMELTKKSENVCPMLVRYMDMRACQIVRLI